MDIIARSAAVNDIDAIERLYDKLSDYFASYKNYPRWKKGVYPLHKHAEDALADRS